MKRRPPHARAHPRELRRIAVGKARALLIVCLLLPGCLEDTAISIGRYEGASTTSGPASDVGGMEGATDEPQESGTNETGVGMALDCESRYGSATFFCDDFERGLRSDWSATDDVSLLLSAPGRASAVARARIDAPDERSSLQLLLPAPLEAGMLAIRSFVYVTPSSLIRDTASVYTVSRLQADTPLLSLDLLPDQGLGSVDRVGGETLSFTPAIAPEQWHCVEWRLVIDDIDGSVAILLDDLPVIESNLIDTRPSAALSMVGVGLRSGSAQSDPIEILFDDVVFATAPIGCSES